MSALRGDMQPCDAYSRWLDLVGLLKALLGINAVARGRELREFRYAPHKDKTFVNM